MGKVKAYIKGASLLGLSLDYIDVSATKIPNWTTFSHRTLHDYSLSGQVRKSNCLSEIITNFDFLIRCDQYKNTFIAAFKITVRKQNKILVIFKNLTYGNKNYHDN